MGEIHIPPRAAQHICEYLDTADKNALRRTSQAFAGFFLSLSEGNLAKWDDWYFSAPASVCLLTPQMPSAHLYSIFCFFQPHELIFLGNTSKDWRQFMDSYWHVKAISQGTIPEVMLSPKSWKQTCLVTGLLTGNFFGPKFYQDHFGTVGPVPPIPQRFVEMAFSADLVDDHNPSQKIRPHYQLLLIPESITISVDEQSQLILDETETLIEGPPRVQAEKRSIKVPFTLNNLAMLVDKCLKRSEPLGFHPDCWPNIFAQHGNDRVSHSHWVYQKITNVLKGHSSEAQESIASSAGLKIVMLFDRVLFNIVSKIQTGKFADFDTNVRTASYVLDNEVVPHSCSTAVQGLLVSKTTDAHAPTAVEVMAESTAPIGKATLKNALLRRAKSL